MTQEQASQLSGIKLDVIKSLEVNNGFLPKSIDSDIYRQGFIKSYSKFLGLNPEYAIAIDRRSEEKKQYQETIFIQKRKSRFNKNSLLLFSLIFIVFGILVYGYIQWKRVNVSPEIFITQPRILSLYNDDSDHILEDNIVLNLQKWTLAGKIDPNDELTINGNKIYINAIGEFQLDVMQSIGESKKFTIETKNRFGNSSRIILTVSRLE